jgi:hypothetical protein
MPVGGHAVAAQGGGATLTPRDLEVVELVGRFRMMAAEQVRDVLFTTQTSKTPLIDP